ncbi:type 4 pilus major pilin [Acetobacter syzygii]|nr:type 4 pilus major pilin [Acetobacter syzygii]NSL92695.1 hypothetical protein [Acetobacter syzygii]
MDTLVPLVFKSVLGVIIMALVLWAGYDLLASNAAQKAIAWQSQLTSKIKGVYTGGYSAVNYSGLTNSVAIKAGAVPDGMTTGDGTTLQGPWSDSYATIESANNGMGFQVTWTNVRSKDCATFVNSQSPTSVTIGGTVVNLRATDASTEVANACNAVSGTAVTDITFEYNN